MTTRSAPPVYIIGDIHGQYEQLVGLLRGVGLVDERLNWAGGAALVWFIGDFFDRELALIGRRTRPLEAPAFLILAR